MEMTRARENISLAEWTHTYVPFGILITLALMAAEMAQDLVRQRMVYSIWVALLFLIPAVCLYLLPGVSSKEIHYWLLFWTFSFASYFAHFYYSVFVFYGSIGAVYEGQGTLIASSNFLVTLWWMFDLLLAWLGSSESRWIRIQRTGAHIYITLTFLMSSIILVGGQVSRALGVLLAASVVICLILRIRAKKAQ